MEDVGHPGLGSFRSLSEIEATHAHSYLIPVVYYIFAKGVAT